MSWNIALIKNDFSVRLTYEKAMELENYVRKAGCDDDLILSVMGDKEYCAAFQFSPDFMEHRDYFRFLLDIPEAKNIIEQSDPMGEILFGSLEGDNANSYWGYRATPEGIVELTGKLVWEVD